MTKLKHILNLVFGGLSGYAYIISIGYVLAYTPLRVLKNCHSVSGAELADCRSLNIVRLLASDFVHDLFCAVIVAVLIGTLQKLVHQKGPAYNVLSFSTGFLVLWLWASWPLENVFPSSSWYVFSAWFLNVVIFVVVYYLIATYVFKIKSPNSALKPTP